jgi:homoserine/homoserine lactone efflux protein
MIDGWMLFAAVALAAVLSPGPAMLAILGHALARGASATVPVILGNGAGVLVMMLASVLGLSALIASIPYGLDVLKWAGVAYLLWLGIKAWRTRVAVGTDAAVPERGDQGFARGLLIALGNPKAILFFGAVLPQFVDPARPLVPQFAALAGTFVGLELLVTTAVAIGAHTFTPLMRKGSSVRLAERVGGSVMILAAVVMAGSSASLFRNIP